MRLLTLNDITVIYDRRPVLDNFDLTVNRGDFVAITGPNGGGKTTLLRVLLRLLTPTRGTVTYYNTEEQPVKRLRIGYLPQKNNIDTHFPISVAEVIRSGLITGFFGRLPHDARRSFDEVVALTDTADLLDRHIGTLSGGQLQRTLLARALVCHPELLVLDEPLSYVDKEFEHRLYDMLREIATQTTIILVSHEMTTFDRMATRRLVIGPR